MNTTSKYSFPRTERMKDGKGKQPAAKFYDVGTTKSTPKNNRFYDIRVKNRESNLFVGNENPSPSHYNIYLPEKIHSGVIEASKRKPI